MCSYCGRHGHTVAYCFDRKNSSKQGSNIAESNTGAVRGRKGQKDRSNRGRGSRGVPRRGGQIGEQKQSGTGDSSRSGKGPEMRAFSAVVLDLFSSSSV